MKKRNLSNTMAVVVTFMMIIGMAIGACREIHNHYYRTVKEQVMADLEQSCDEDHKTIDYVVVRNRSITGWTKSYDIHMHCLDDDSYGVIHVIPDTI